MIVKIPKDIDATEAKIFKGLSLRKGLAVLAAGAVVALCLFVLHLPVYVGGVLGGIILFFFLFEKQGMNAFTFVSRLSAGFLGRQFYVAEPILSQSIQTDKEQQKAAILWNRQLRREQRRHPKAEVIKTVRCSHSSKTRK